MTPARYRPPDLRATLRRRILRALAAGGPMRGPVRPRQRGLSLALDLVDDGQHAQAALVVLRAAGVAATPTPDGDAR